MANLSVLNPGKWILDIFGKNKSTFFQPFLDISTFFQKLRSGPLTLARQGSILAGAPTVMTAARSLHSTPARVRMVVVEQTAQKTKSMRECWVSGNYALFCLSCNLADEKLNMPPHQNGVCGSVRANYLGQYWFTSSGQFLLGTISTLRRMVSRAPARTASIQWFSGLEAARFGILCIQW